MSYLSAEVAYLSVVATKVNRYSGAFKDYVHIIFITCCLVRHVEEEKEINFCPQHFLKIVRHTNQSIDLNIIRN